MMTKHCGMAIILAGLTGVSATIAQAQTPPRPSRGQTIWAMYKDQRLEYNGSKTDIVIPIDCGSRYLIGYRIRSIPGDNSTEIRPERDVTVNSVSVVLKPVSSPTGEARTVRIKFWCSSHPIPAYPDLY